MMIVEYGLVVLAVAVTATRFFLFKAKAQQ